VETAPATTAEPPAVEPAGCVVRAPCRPEPRADAGSAGPCHARHPARPVVGFPGWTALCAGTATAF